VSVKKVPAVRWILPLWAVVLGFAVVTLVESHNVGVPLRDPGDSMTIKRPLTTLLLFAIAVVLEALWRGRGQWRSAWRERWTPRRMALALSALVAYHVVYFCYHNLKSGVVFHAPRDQMLENWDKDIFFGHHPAVLLHDLLGQSISAYLLDGVYQSFTGVTTVALILAVVVPRDARRSLIYISGGVWLWVLGVGSYYLIPSLGPFATAPHDFAGLPHLDVHGAQARLLSNRSLMRSDPGNPRAFAAIAAFASLHVAVTSYAMLMARYFKLRWASTFMYVFVGLTGLATIYLGCHFFVDLVAGFLIAAVAVWLGRWMCDDYRREPVVAPPELAEVTYRGSRRIPSA
jgi:membrane-associated phospholipid phosphatase